MEKIGSLLLVLGTLISFPDRLNKEQRQRIEMFLISKSKFILSMPRLYFEKMSDKLISFFEATIDCLENLADKWWFVPLLFLPALIISGIICIKYKFGIGVIWLVASPIIIICSYVALYIFIATMYLGLLFLILIYVVLFLTLFCLLKPGLKVDKLREKYGFISTYGTLGWLLILTGSIFILVGLMS